MVKFAVEIEAPAAILLYPILRKTPSSQRSAASSDSPTEVPDGPLPAADNPHPRAGRSDWPSRPTHTWCFICGLYCTVVTFALPTAKSGVLRLSYIFGVVAIFFQLSPDERGISNNFTVPYFNKLNGKICGRNRGSRSNFTVPYSEKNSFITASSRFFRFSSGSSRRSAARCR